MVSGQKGVLTRSPWRGEITGKTDDGQSQTPTENRKESPMVGLNVKDIHHLSYKKPTTPATQPKRNHHHPELSLFSNQLVFKTTPPNFLLFSPSNNFPLLCLLVLPMAFATTCSS